jgi:hypothetical protein
VNVKAHELIADALRHSADIHEGLEVSAVADVYEQGGDATYVIRLTLRGSCPLYPDPRDIAADTISSVKLLGSGAEDHARYYTERKEVVA